MRLVDQREERAVEVVDQRVRPVARGAAGEVARVVLDAVTEADLAHHLEVVHGALPQALGLQEFPLPLEFGDALLHLRLDGLERVLDLGVRGDEVLGGGDVDGFQILLDLAGERGDALERLDLVAPEGEADAVLGVAGEDIHRIAAHAEGAGLGLQVVARVLDAHELIEELLAVHPAAAVEADEHALVVDGRAEAVDAGDGGDDHHVAPVQQRVGRGEAQALDALVDG